MQLAIDRDALELAFRLLLTCGCPVSDDEESRLHRIIESTPADTSIDYDEILHVFPPHANTPLQRLGDFSVWQAPTGIDTHTIDREQVVRHFSCSYHWHHVTANAIQNAYKKVRHVPTWFLAHMLLPVRVTGVDGDSCSAVYEYRDGRIVLANLYAPTTGGPQEDEIWAVHFAGLLCRLSEQEHQAAVLMLDANPLLRQFRDEVDSIDYCDFERYGDYQAQCRERHRAYYD